VEIPVTDAAKQNNMNVVLRLTCRKKTGEISLQISQEFNIAFHAPRNSESTQMI